MQPGVLHIWEYYGNPESTTPAEWIVNLPTKRHWADDSRCEDIEAGLKALKAYLLLQGPVRVAVPALGCGNGGLDWETVKPMISDTLAGLEALILVFSPYENTEKPHRAAGK